MRMETPVIEADNRRSLLDRGGRPFLLSFQVIGRGAAKSLRIASTDPRSQG